MKTYDKMKVAAVQFEPVHRDVNASVAIAEECIRGIDADLIVLPELFSTGYFFRRPEEIADIADAIPSGTASTSVFQWAREKNAVVVAGLAEVAGDRLYNSAIVALPDGRYHVYRKVHLYYEEKAVFEPGDLGFPIFDVADRSGQTYRLGVMICFDWYFPESARALALGGADVIAHPSNLVRKDCPRAMPIRALENHVFTVTSNRIGSETNAGEKLTFIGQSLICSPAGEVLASAGRSDATVITADVDPMESRRRSINSRNDLFHDRRPDTYRALQE